jgi:hypothetical protein
MNTGKSKGKLKIFLKQMKMETQHKKPVQRNKARKEESL